MAPLIIIVGLLQVAGGIFAYMEAASAIHQILGAISFGMGFLCLGLGGIVMKLGEILDTLKPVPVAPSADPATSYLPRVQS